MHLLSMYGGDIVFHIYSNEEIQSLADFKGLKMRTSNTYKAFFDALGARTLNMPRREIFTAMECGAVDAYANLDSEVMSQGWFEVSKYKLVPGFFHPIIIVGVNMQKWQSLNAHQQEVLTARQGCISRPSFPRIWAEGTGRSATGSSPKRA